MVINRRLISSLAFPHQRRHSCSALLLLPKRVGVVKIVGFFYIDLFFFSAQAQQPDLLDDYIDSYAEDYLQVVHGPLPTMGVDRVALWPQGNAQPGPGTMGSNVNTGSMLQRMPSRNELGNQGSLNLEVPVAVNLSRAGGGSMRRKPTRRATQRRPKAAYEEEEEGYVSGEYDDPYELSNIRIKVRSIYSFLFQVIYRLYCSCTTKVTCAE
jgi:hypothetical protein